LSFIGGFSVIQVVRTNQREQARTTLHHHVRAWLQRQVLSDDRKLNQVVEDRDIPNEIIGIAQKALPRRAPGQPDLSGRTPMMVAVGDLRFAASAPMKKPAEAGKTFL
jgi:hypothetical protein